MRVAILSVSKKGYDLSIKIKELFSFYLSYIPPILSPVDYIFVQ